MHGNILLWEVGFSVPLFLTFLLKSSSEGTLTLGWAIHAAFVISIGGAVAAIIFWYGVALPLKKSRDLEGRGDTKRTKK